MTPSLRIGLIYEGIQPDRVGGVERRNLSLAEELQKRGHAVTLIGPVTNASLLPQSVPTLTLGPPARLYDRRGRRRIAHPLHFASLMRRIPFAQFDILETASVPVAHLPVIGALSSLANVPLVVTWHEFWGNYWQEHLTSRWWRLFAAYESFCARSVGSTLLSVSQLTADRVRQTTGRPVTIVPNGVPAELLTWPRTRSLTAPPLLFVGRLIKEKRIDLLIRALPRLSSSSQTLLLIIGEGPELRRLQALAATVGVAHRIDWWPLVSEDTVIWEAMASATLLVQPSAREGFGMVVLEAMAVGTPVVSCSSPLSAASELVTHGVTGIISDPTPTALAEAIEGMLTDPGRLALMRYEAQQAAAKYLWPTVADHFEALLLETVERRRRRRFTRIA